MRSLPAEARASLCAMFGLTRTPINAAAQADRIWHFVGTKRAQIASRAGTQIGGTTVPAGGTMQGAPAQAQPGTVPNFAAAPQAGTAALSSSAAAAASSSTATPAVATTHPAASGASAGPMAAPTSSVAAAAVVPTRFVWPPGSLGPGGAGAATSTAGQGATGPAASGPHGPIAPLQAGQIAGTGGAAPPHGGLQAHQPAGAGGAAQAQGVPQAQQLAVASPLDSMITPAQVLAIAGLPFAAALALVQAAQIPTQVGDSDGVIRGKLTVAVWAAETLRSPLDFRGGLRTSVRTPALDYLGVDATWAEPLQDAFLTSALTRCQS